MPWKYKAKMVSCPDSCPPDGRVPIEKVSYRLVRKEKPDDSDFLPPFLDYMGGVVDCCSDLALSHYSTLAKATRKARNLLGRVNRSLKFSHIATVHIRPIDGECTAPGNSGHFDLHEYVVAQMASRVTAVVEVSGGP